LDGVGRPGLGDGAVAAIQQVIVDTGARADLEAAIEALAAEAVAALDDVELLPTARRELAALAEFVVLRAI
jgi:geranylgeranyl pyrophosphate synthase